MTRLERLEAERSLLAAAVEQTGDAIIVTDTSGRILFVNSAFERVSGYRRDEVIGRNPSLLQAASQDPSVFADMWSTLVKGQTWAGELTNQHKHGGTYTDAVRITPLRDDQGQVTAYLSVQLDISHLREVEADLVLEARVRALLSEAIQAGFTTTTLEEIAQAVCDGLVSLPDIDVAQVLTFLDEDEVTVTASRAPEGFPFTTGDRLPPSRAARLRHHATVGAWGERADDRPSDVPIPGGLQALAFGPIHHDEEVCGVLAVGTLDPAAARVVADKMPSLVAFGASANRFLVERLHGHRSDHRIRRDIDAALTSQAFRPVFQPIIDLVSGHIAGYEALTRFSSDVPPHQCFADAWAVGYGPELELATLAAAVDAARHLPAGGWLDVNVSPRLLEESDRLAAILARADRPVVVEITEHEVVEDYTAVRKAVAALGGQHDAGSTVDVRMAVDDAGVGIANFGHIIELRPHFVKIDLSLVRGVDVDLGRQALVAAMHHFARTADCLLIAEGVETEAEARTLIGLGVELAQGFWFGVPAPAVE